MILDASLVLADQQAITVTAASSNYIDTLAGGDAYVGPWLVLVVNTTFTSGGSTTYTLDLETDDNTSFSSATVLASFGSIAKATLVAGYTKKIRIPPGAERYLRVNGTVATGPFTGGRLSLFVVKDVDISINE